MKTTPPKLWAIIPAAGSGRRFSSSELKQYQLIAGQTVLEHTVHALYQLPLTGCVISIHQNDQLAKTITFPESVEFCQGGRERMDSVLAGLHHIRSYADDDDYILVHDAARPCLHQAQITQILEFCQTGADAAIIAVPVRDTLKKADKDQMIEKTIDRQKLWQAQTPQIVKYSILLQALENAIAKNILVTDEASALEHLNIPVHLIAGRSDNIKITYAEDLDLARLIMASKS